MMKINLLLILITFSVIAFSQQKIEVRSGSDSFSIGSREVLVADIYEADVKFVKKAWKKLIKQYNGKIKMGKEIFSDNVMISSLSSNTVDIYTKISKKGDLVEIVCAVDLGGTFLSEITNSSEFGKFEELLRKFAIEVSKDAIKVQIEDQKKVFSKMEKDQERLISDKSKMEKEIETYKQKIIDNESAIEQNIKDQKLKTLDIASQKVIILDLKEKENAVN